MYSVVLAAMLTVGTTSTPAWHGCHGCHGCCGGCWGCCGGCYGCHGCYGCCGGCYGCCGGCWGCYGGGCYGGYVVGGYGCYGLYSYYGCSGCYGVFGGVSLTAAPGYSGAALASAPAAAGQPMARAGQPDAPATVVVQMPNDAKLFVEGQAVNLDPTTRSFTTPRLPASGEYVYTLKVETVRDGKTTSESRDVRIRAGQVARADFNSADQVSSRIMVKLPDNARLFVEGQAVSLKPDRSFETPKLDANRQYQYTLKAEVVRNGQTFSESKDVVFRAGTAATVDFGDLSGARVAQR